MVVISFVHLCTRRSKSMMPMQTMGPALTRPCNIATKTCYTSGYAFSNNLTYINVYIALTQTLDVGDNTNVCCKIRFSNKLLIEAITIPTINDKIPMGMRTRYASILLHY